MNVDDVAFDDRGLVPVVAQDAVTGDVLMLAYADREALEQTLATGQMHYFSRSRQRLWRKGEESGHTQSVVDLSLDCDADAVLARVEQIGPACHRETPTCFSGDATPGGILTELGHVVVDRDGQDPASSYTARLLADRTLMGKKVGEEATELVMALANEDRQRVAEEAADLIYHVLVACWGRKVSMAEVLRVLRGRRP